MFDYFVENSVKSIVFWVIGLIVLWLAATVFGLNPRTSFPTVPSTKWQAVFLSNNQVYFGKLQTENATYLTLSDVYYLRTATDLENASSLNLIKLGGELHGPEDTIYVPKSSVLFWENMKADSRVVQTIQGSHH